MATKSIEHAGSIPDSHLDKAQADLHERLLRSYAPGPSAPVRRRRPTREQGKALETLGHAVEYLIDTRMFYADHPDSRADDEAARLLMHASREVFEECTEIVSTTDRIRRWFLSHVPASGDHKMDEGTHASSALQL